MLKNNSLKNAKYSLAFSLTITATAYAAENTVSSTTDTPSSTINSPPKSDEIKWAPLETNKPEQVDTSQINTPQKREWWEERLSELNMHYQKLRQQAQADGIELSNIPPWDKVNKNSASSLSAMQTHLERMQAVINEMTPEERDVCTTVHRLSMGLMQSSPNYGGMPRYGYNYSYPDEYRRMPNNYGNYGGGYGRPYAYPNYVPEWQGGAGSWW